MVPHCWDVRPLLKAMQWFCLTGAPTVRQPTCSVALMGYTREKILSALQWYKALGVLLSLVYGFSLGGNCPLWGESGTGAGGSRLTEIGALRLSEFGFYATCFLYRIKDPWGKYLEQAIAREPKTSAGNFETHPEAIDPAAIERLIASGVLIVNLQFRAGLFIGRSIHEASSGSQLLPHPQNF